ncbi:hypothetical protein ACNSTQ_17705 [Alkalihalobacterium sp. APHAB7]
MDRFSFQKLHAMREEPSIRLAYGPKAKINFAELAKSISKVKRYFPINDIGCNQS